MDFIQLPEIPIQHLANQEFGNFAIFNILSKINHYNL